MSLTAGSRIGSYDVIAPLGAGGMGEVFRARDTKLKREVAIKALPAEFALDPGRVARFQREAEALAALNHPHIAGIHEFAEAEGSRFLVMELVEGTTLAELIAGSGLSALGSAQGPKAKAQGLPLIDTLDIAVQIADALAAAHDKGIIHRDLKPANIKITPDGRVKVLDFGLAKIFEADGASGLTQSPTVLTNAGAGVLMGTAAYMSPEQARGRVVDRTGDVWAFGCVLYEMLTGRQAFAGETVGEILGEIFKSEPDWSRLPADTPASVKRLLLRCLRKDHRHRLQHIADARIEIEEAQHEPPPAMVTSSAVIAAPRRADRVAWGAAGILAVVALGLGAALLMRRPAPAAPEMNVEIATPSSSDLLSFAISPDGQNVVFQATFEGRARLAIRSLQSAVMRQLAGTENAQYPFWSPDGRSVAFFADTRLKRVDVTTGLVQTLAQTGSYRGGTWSKDGVILFAPAQNRALVRLPAGGGTPVEVTRIDGQKQVGHRFPQFLPDGRHFVFYVQGASPEISGIYLGALDEPETHRLGPADAAAIVAPSGQLLFVRQGTLFSQTLDAERATLEGNPLPLAEGVALDPASFGVGVSASVNGTIAYRSGSSGQSQLIWFDRQGKPVGNVGGLDAGTPFNLDLSPDGSRVVADRLLSGNRDIWLVDVATGGLDRVTFDPRTDIDPIWSRDGKSIIFTSSRATGVFDLYRRAANNAGSDELLLDTPRYNKVPMDVSPDGRFLLYRVVNPATVRDLWALPLDGAGPSTGSGRTELVEGRKPFPIVATSADEREGQFSPDGKWIAYQSDESGRFEVYVQAFPGPGGKAQISVNGGAQVRWRSDGKELFFIDPLGTLMAVPTRLDDEHHAVEHGTPAALFAMRIVGGQLPSTNKHQYAVAKDGQRFLVNALQGGDAPVPITLLLNWKPPASK